MNSLWIDTSTDQPYLFLAKAECCLELVLLPAAPKVSLVLASELERLLERHNLLPERVYIGRGPGALTGIRVGASLGLGAALGWQVPVFGFCSLYAWVPEESGPFAVLVDLKSEGVALLQGEKKGGEVAFRDWVVVTDVKDVFSDVRYVGPNLTTRWDLSCQQVLPSCSSLLHLASTQANFLTYPYTPMYTQMNSKLPL
jgi:hypothetical protein